MTTQRTTRVKEEVETFLETFLFFHKDQVRLGKGKVEEKIVKGFGECGSAKVEEKRRGGEEATWLQEV